jgi:hypothetical protein
MELTPQDARYILQIGLAIIRSIRHGFQEVKLKDIKDGPELSANERKASETKEDASPDFDSLEQ